MRASFATRPSASVPPQEYKYSLPANNIDMSLRHTTRKYSTADAGSLLQFPTTSSLDSDLFPPVNVNGNRDCPVCCKEVKGDKQDFKRHYMTHTGERPFACNFCQYRACHKSNLLKHVKRQHDFDVAIDKQYKSYFQ